MTRRNVLASLGFLTAAPLLAQPAPARVRNRNFEGGMTLAGSSTLLSLKLTSSSGRDRIATGQIWLSDDARDAHEINGRFSRDRKRLTFSAGLQNNQEIRFDGKFSERGTFLAGRVMTFANGAPVAGGTFSLREVSTPRQS